jgi:Ca-activated chloride channel homolog
MKNNNFTLIVFMLLWSACSYANGLLMPTNKNYPKDFLKVKSTRVTVQISGLVAETTVYQEFVNEWTSPTDAVYSFPLPANARATQFLYWSGDVVFQAVLKVKEQVVNPGTGEGGVAAEVNNYIGTNGIKIALNNIGPGEIQKVELHYISQCDYYQGKCTYSFPLNTDQFIKYPLDLLQFDINVSSNQTITNYNIPNFSGYNVLSSDQHKLTVELVKSKAYINQDFEFSYESNTQALGMDFYSVANDTSDGHFALFVRPQNQAQPDSILPKRIIFLVSNVNTMLGDKLDRSIYAISKSLDQLTTKDYFNVVSFGSIAVKWKTTPVAATTDNVNSAKDFLTKIGSSYSININVVLKDALSQIQDNNFSNAILLFTDGRSVLDPKDIESSNKFNTGIFPIGIGTNLDRSKLEMIAALNYGFVTYISLTDNLSDKMLRVFNQISQPILKNVGFEYGKASVSNVVPQKALSTYAGSSFFMTGRYKNAGPSSISIAGTSAKGITAYGFLLDFTNVKSENKLAQSLWAKEKIDAIERQIDVYGEKDSLKNEDIKISLAYGIRCKYTAYIADYTTHPSTGIDVQLNSTATIPESYLVGNYPNPFNPSTKIRFYLDQKTTGQVKLIKIYNILGQLVAVIDISNLSVGMNEVMFNGRDMLGKSLPSGIYLVQLQVGNRIYSTIKINMIK